MISWLLTEIGTIYFGFNRESETDSDCNLDIDSLQFKCMIFYGKP